MLQDKVLAIYCLMDDLLKEMDHKEHNNRRFPDSQVLSTALVSALYFRGNQSLALAYMRSHIFEDVLQKKWFHQTVAPSWGDLDVHPFTDRKGLQIHQL